MKVQLHTGIHSNELEYDSRPQIHYPRWVRA